MKLLFLFWWEDISPIHYSWQHFVDCVLKQQLYRRCYVLQAAEQHTSAVLSSIKGRSLKSDHSTKQHLYARIRANKGSRWLLKHCGPGVVWQMNPQRTSRSLLVQPYQAFLFHTSFQLQAASTNETHGEERRPMKQRGDVQRDVVLQIGHFHKGSKLSVSQQVWAGGVLKPIYSVCFADKWILTLVWIQLNQTVSNDKHVHPWLTASSPAALLLSILGKALAF